MSDFERYPDEEDKDNCEGRGVSVWDNLDSVRALVSNWRNAAKYGIAEIALRSSHGVVHPFPQRLPGYHLWWIPPDVKPIDSCVQRVLAIV
jgi:hypothetical protein